MSTTRTISTGNWIYDLVDAIQKSEDGDEIIVSTEVKRMLAKRVIEHMCPDKHIVLIAKAPERTL